MDPNATLKALIEALYSQDEEAAYLAASDLAEWLKKGGFVPTVDSNTLLTLLKFLDL